MRSKELSTSFQAAGTFPTNEVRKTSSKSTCTYGLASNSSIRSVPQANVTAAASIRWESTEPVVLWLLSTSDAKIRTSSTKVWTISLGWLTIGRSFASSCGRNLVVLASRKSTFGHHDWHASLASFCIRTRALRRVAADALNWCAIDDTAMPI